MAYDPTKGRRKRTVPERGYGNGKLTGALIAWLGQLIKEAATVGDEELPGSPQLWWWTFLVTFAVVMALIEWKT